MLLHHDYTLQSKVKRDKKEDQEVIEGDVENTGQEVSLRLLIVPLSFTAVLFRCTIVTSKRKELVHFGMILQ